MQKYETGLKVNLKKRISMLEKVIDWACKSDARTKFLVYSIYTVVGFGIFLIAFNIYLLMSGNF